MAGKIHELLAVEAEVRDQAKSAQAKILSLFTEGKTRFIGFVKTYHPLLEGGEGFDPEEQALSSTVKDELDVYAADVGRYLDVTLQKEISNVMTSADVIVNGVEMFTEMPSPSLLNLEARLGEIRRVLAAVPTLDPKEIWSPAGRSDAFESETRKTYRTAKVPKTHVEYEATEEHPAQVNTYFVDERIGTTETKVFSGAVTEATKETWLERVDELSRAVKKARQRANDRDHVAYVFADKLFGYIFDG